MRRNRWKWIIASAGISVSLAAGSIHAQSDQGLPVAKWYQALTQRTKTEIANEAATQRAQAAKRVSDAAERLAAQAEATLSRAAEDDGEIAATDIRLAGQAYADRLDAAAAELAERARRERIEPYVADTTAAMSEELEALAQSTIAEMTRELDAEGSAASGNEEVQHKSIIDNRGDE
ncbi:hypothetical protein [Cohnella sp. JJ-181]|uniref:hypothetical protein n=1 Tax=Cohnella rhizoplanae TaxID=2974897 RepID=UPI0022FFA33C|nr:hypothetical protein [Cohnella sp. JJ-181]CAI6058847.1 hypothetical protein COHCIP112018_01790 [Cohnella sp. JJ-181]